MKQQPPSAPAADLHFENSEETPCQVGNTTWVFELELPLPEFNSAEDEVDSMIIEQRKNEPTESMEDVFQQLGIG
ncbi:MAG: hypothetical protein K9N62_03875 [Verrucomicrobia bacterium]|nr:hypothetical protein [Verrucomicrobiota bacterium]